MQEVWKVNILIIGGSSFVGAYQTEKLVSDKKFEGQVVATGRNTKFREWYEKMGVPYYYVDICDKTTFDAIKKYHFDVVVLCAALMPSNVPRIEEYDDVINYYEVNLMGTINVLEFCRENGIPRVIAFGTGFDCRLYDEDVIISEKTPLKFSYTDDHAGYVMSSNAKREVMKYYNEKYAMKNIYLRLPTILGVGPHGGMFRNGVYCKSGLQIFIEKAKKGEEIEIFGDGNIKKNLLYVKDLVLEVQKIIENTEAKGFYNIGYDKSFTLLETVNAIVNVFGSANKQSQIKLCPEILNNGGFPQMSMEKLKKEIGFFPEFPDIKAIMIDYKYELERGVYTELFKERYNENE